MDKYNKLIKSLEGYESQYYVGICVFNKKGQVLLGKRREDGIYTSPGGGCDPGESPVETAQRELYEEARITAMRYDLRTLPTQTAGNGKPIFCFYYITDQEPNSDMDPDQEVPKWVYYDQDNLPKDLVKDKNRLNTVNNAIMRVSGLIKSETQMGDQIGEPDLDTGDFITSKKFNSPYERIIRDVMKDFSYGDVARPIQLPAGTLYLAKVDDGMYSGFMQKKYKIEGMELEDKASMRIEKINIPELVALLYAKEWIYDEIEPQEAAQPEKEEPNQLEEKLESYKADKIIRILELLSALS